MAKLTALFGSLVYPMQHDWGGPDDASTSVTDGILRHFALKLRQGWHVMASTHDGWLSTFCLERFCGYVDSHLEHSCLEGAETNVQAEMTLPSNTASCWLMRGGERRKLKSTDDCQTSPSAMILTSSLIPLKKIFFFLLPLKTRAANKKKNGLI